MTESPDAWIYVGNCPICQCGLRRVRACTGGPHQNGLHGYVLCDDCETMWLNPDVHSSATYPDAESPSCPVCNQPLFGPQSRWATLADLKALGWRDACIIEPIQSQLAADLLEPDDIAVDLDSPEPLPVHQYLDHLNYSQSDDWLDGSPIVQSRDEAAEPKPGC